MLYVNHVPCPFYTPTSAFRGMRKKSFWQTWNAYEEVTDAFIYLVIHPFEHILLHFESFKIIERLVVIIMTKQVTP